MGKYMCVTHIICRISRYLCNDSIVYPRRDDRDHFSEATSKFSVKLKKKNNWKLQTVHLKTLTRHLQITFVTEIPGVFFMRTGGGIFNYWSSSIKKNILFFSSGWILIIILLIRIHPPLFSLSPFLLHSIRQWKLNRLLRSFESRSIDRQVDILELASY
jgi:hypothetical protein